MEVILSRMRSSQCIGLLPRALLRAWELSVGETNGGMYIFSLNKPLFLLFYMMTGSALEDCSVSIKSIVSALILAGQVFTFVSVTQKKDKF